MHNVDDSMPCGAHWFDMLGVRLSLSSLTSACTGLPVSSDGNACMAMRDMRTTMCREEPSAKSQRENGKSLSYAAVIADGSAPQQPAGEQATSAEPALSRPAEEGNASRSTRSTAAQPSVVAEGAAADAKGGNSRQSKSGLRQPLVWLDLEMTGASIFLSYFHRFANVLHVSYIYG